MSSGAFTVDVVGHYVVTAELATGGTTRVDYFAFEAAALTTDALNHVEATAKRQVLQRIFMSVSKTWTGAASDLSTGIDWRKFVTTEAFAAWRATKRAA